MHVSRGAACCARNRHQTWTNAVLAQVRVPFYAFVSLYDAQTITCGQTVPMLSCYNTSYSTCVQQVVIAIQFALSHSPGSYLPPIWPLCDCRSRGRRLHKNYRHSVRGALYDRRSSLRIIRFARIFLGQRFSSRMGVWRTENDGSGCLIYWE